jgi:hypothetical protein
MKQPKTRYLVDYAASNIRHPESLLARWIQPHKKLDGSLQERLLATSMSEPSEWLTAYSVKAPEDMNATSLFYGGCAPVYPCCNDSLNRIYTTDVSAVLKGISEGKEMVSLGGRELNISKWKVNDFVSFFS